MVVEVSQMNLVFGGPLETKQDGDANDRDSRVPTSMVINVLDYNFHDFDKDWFEGSFKGNQVWSAHDDDGWNNAVKQRIIPMPYPFWSDTDRGPSLDENSDGIKKMESHDVKLPHWLRLVVDSFLF